MNKTRIKNEAGESEEIGEILVYGPISEDSWWGDEVTPKEFRDDLKALGDVKNIQVRINSYGGHVSAGTAIYSLLKQHPANVTVVVDGFALSAASVIAMAGDKVVMPSNAMMMIHNPSSGVRGDAHEMRKVAGILDKIREGMLSVYMQKTGLPKDKLITLLDEETWMTAEEAKERGFADEVIEPLVAVAAVKPGNISINGQEFDLSGYKRAPKGLLEKIEREVKSMTEEDKILAGAPAIDPTSVAAEPQSPPVNVEELIANAVSAAVAEERARVAAIEDMAISGAEEIIAAAKADGTPAAEVATKVVKALKTQGAVAFMQRKEDAMNSGADGISAASTADGIGNPKPTDEESKRAEALKKELKERRGQK
ncbi:head maturation protease, ClpP-related [Cloacibacillus porcorum]|uniref:head maturation protease, ClpP-related n=1 Tax=Cloacibacillus porcorum TaxID=1197717 RepID=UPI002670DEB6|nr:head maturation protease, ClpP-related [Cloacibacillus porcorum]